eukprot:6211804-Pleurochrysis_carterae.AAC.9
MGRWQCLMRVTFTSAGSRSASLHPVPSAQNGIWLSKTLLRMRLVFTFLLIFWHMAIVSASFWSARIWWFQRRVNKLAAYSFGMSRT